MTSKLLIDSDSELELDTAALPLQNELLWVVDWLALLGSPVYAGPSIPTRRSFMTCRPQAVPVADLLRVASQAGS